MENTEIPFQRIYSYVIKRAIDNKYYESSGYGTITYWGTNFSTAKKYRFKISAWFFAMFSLKDSVNIVKV